MDSTTLPQNQEPLPQPHPAESDGSKKPSPNLSGGFHFLPFAKEVFRRFGEDNAPLVAAALSFFTVLAAVPMLLIAVSVFGYFIDPAAARAKVLEALTSFLPSLASASHLQNDLLFTVTQLLVNVKEGPKTLTGIVGLVGLIWSASAVFLNMEIAFNGILGIKTKRKFLQARLTAIGMILMIGALLFASIALTGTVNFIKGYNISVGGFSPGKLPFIWDLLFFLIPIALSFGMFLAIYKIIPNGKIHWKAGAWGAGFATLFFELAKHGFGWYVGHFAHFDKVYGTLGTLVFLVTWILYSYFIILMGAEVADVYCETVLSCAAVNPD